MDILPNQPHKGETNKEIFYCFRGLGVKGTFVGFMEGTLMHIVLGHGFIVEG